VAAIKVPLLCQLLLDAGCEVKVAATKAAAYFFSQQQLPPAVGAVAGDEDEWHAWARVGDPVLHIELRRWADVLLFAPLSANTLAKLANGLCDNLATCVARAWDYQRPLLVRGCVGKDEVRALAASPGRVGRSGSGLRSACVWRTALARWSCWHVLNRRPSLVAALRRPQVAPAMNTFMWDSPFTAQHLERLQQLGVSVVAPVAKKLACGDVGTGAMAAPETIAAEVLAALPRLGFSQACAQGEQPACLQRPATVAAAAAAAAGGESGGGGGGPRAPG
jgi:phosphopantothenoylcysteine decarboxylase